MRLWLITTDIDGYDSYDGHVIAAETEHDARLLAMDNAADEGVKAWNAQHSTVKLIAGECNQPKGIILSSFNAG